MTGRALTSQERQVRMIPRDHAAKCLHANMDGATGRIDVEAISPMISRSVRNVS